jgi:hypothetical protein
MNDGETVDAPGDSAEGEERTEGEVDAADALDALADRDDRDGRGDADDRDAAAADLEAAVSLFAEVVATTSPAEAHARLLRPTGDDLTSPDYTIQIDG